MKTNSAKRFSRATGLLAVAVFGGNILAQAQTLTTIHSFTGTNGDGQYPFPQHLTFDSTGALYGTTIYNGSPYWGTVFQLVPPTIGGGDWKENVLHVFQGNSAGDGQQPEQGVVFDQNGNLYGTAAGVFELSPPAQQGGAWKEIVYFFGGGEYKPAGPGEVVFGPNGSLYGTTYSGGGPGLHCQGYQRDNVGCGTVFELTPPTQPGGSWSNTVLYSFPAYVGDGIHPGPVVTFDTQGNLYATAQYGGSKGYGMVLKLTPPAGGSGAWTETVLHNFSGGSDGEYPGRGLLLGPNGVLYGNAQNSGISGSTGIVFQLTPPSGGSGAWTETVLSAGPSVDAVLAIDPSGNLYGTTVSGGSYNCGTIFKLAPPSWTRTVLHEWPNGANGGSCGSNGGTNESRVTYHNGLLYGTTTYLGSANLGSVFTLVP